MRSVALTGLLVSFFVGAICFRFRLPSTSTTILSCRDKISPPRTFVALFSKKKTSGSTEDEGSDTAKTPLKFLKSKGLPSKMCACCNRPMVWRKSWAKNWDEVKYCSEKCRRSK
jgi:hypothetical protein